MGWRHILVDPSLFKISTTNDSVKNLYCISCLFVDMLVAEKTSVEVTDDNKGHHVEQAYCIIIKNDFFDKTVH
jgi:hypothetical protein